MATKKAKTQNPTNFNKIVNLAKKVNTELSEVADVVAEDLTSNVKQVRETASKSVKNTQKATEKVNFSKSTAKIKETFAAVNTQVKDTAVEIADDLLKAGSQMKDSVMAKAQETVDAIDVAGAAQKVGETGRALNQFALTTADEMADNMLKNGQKWQKITAKAVHGGFQLAEKQQDIVFDALETAKKQLTKSSSRLVKIFTEN